MYWWSLRSTWHNLYFLRTWTLKDAAMYAPCTVSQCRVAGWELDIRSCVWIRPRLGHCFTSGCLMIMLCRSVLHRFHPPAVFKASFLARLSYLIIRLVHFVCAFRYGRCPVLFHKMLLHRLEPHLFLFYMLRCSGMLVIRWRRNSRECHRMVDKIGWKFVMLWVVFSRHMPKSCFSAISRIGCFFLLYFAFFLCTIIILC